jgi:hypothetical protein
VLVVEGRSMEPTIPTARWRSSARTRRRAAGSRQGQIVLAALHDASDVDVIATFETVLGAAATPSAAQR